MLARPSGRPHSAAAAYALAAATLVAAVGLRYVLDPWMRDSLPLVTIFGAVVRRAPPSRGFATVRHGCAAIDRGLRGWVRLTAIRRNLAREGEVHGA